MHPYTREKKNSFLYLTEAKKKCSVLWRSLRIRSLTRTPNHWRKACHHGVPCTVMELIRRKWLCSYWALTGCPQISTQDSLSCSSLSIKISDHFFLLVADGKLTGEYSLSKWQCTWILLILMSLGGQLIWNLQKTELLISVSSSISDRDQPNL